MYDDHSAKVEGEDWTLLAKYRHRVFDHHVFYKPRHRGEAKKEVGVDAIRPVAVPQTAAESKGW
jgi:hypothetical protein